MALITDLDQLGGTGPSRTTELRSVTDVFPFRVSSYYRGIMRFPGDPLWRQAVPDVRECEDASGWEDPLAEEALSPVPNLVHRYPNRVLWLVSTDCATHCRFCTRKRRWRSPVPLTDESVRGALDYIGGNPQITDVLLSGGDPLLLSQSRLEFILGSLRKIPHVSVIRIGSRVPCVMPQLVTEELSALLRRFQPLYVNLHFNHPWELTTEARRACALLADAGIPLGSQTVLLKGINDDSEVLGELFQGLLAMRVRPYYLMQMDLTQGTAHFRTPVHTGLKILRALRNHISGLAMPHFVMDLPGGQGKIPLLPSYVESVNEETLVLRDYQGRPCHYPLLPGEAAKLGPWLGLTARKAVRD